MLPKHARASGFLSSRLFDGLEQFRDLEARIEALPTPGERGAAFEVFVEAYLATQKRHQAKEIWPEGTIPPATSRELNLSTRQGVGIDGVYNDTSGAYYAYQVKFRTGRPSLPLEEVATFFAVTEAFAKRVLITNSSSFASEIEIRPDFFCIRGSNFDELEPNDFAAIRAWLAGRPAPIPPKEPRPHQREALAAILLALRTGDRATAVMACGSGKTLVALWVAEGMGAKRILVLVPSLALIRQTLHEWLHETAWTDASYLCVCSDKTVKAGADQIQMDSTDLDFPVHTDPEKTREFLAGPGIRIVFSTYQSAKVVAEGLGGSAAFDLGIFDEAHKTAGPEGKRNAFALKDANLLIRKRLFMTATPRHASTTKRTKEGEQALVYSMDEPATYGPIAYTLGFAEAAKRRIICDYKIVVSVVTSTSLNDELLSRGVVTVQDDPVKARQVANQIALEKAVREYGVGHIISFHGNVASAKSFTNDDSAGIGSVIPGIVARHVNGEMRTAYREGVMAEFRQAPLGIVSNARCLTEGVDVPAVDMVAFMAPKRSKVDIVQAAGRAMRIPRDDPDKETGFIFLPLYVEEGDGETEEEALERTGMDELVDVLNAMKEQDVVLADMIQAAQEERGRTGGFDDSKLGESLAVLGPTLSIEVLRHAITMRLLDSVGVSWDFRYGQLCAYRERFGTSNVPAEWQENSQLGGWVNKQRDMRKEGLLSSNRIARLDEVGFVWDPRTDDWAEQFSALSGYKAKQGDCNVPVGWPEKPDLGTWVITQRTFKSQGRLSTERATRLDALGFEWDPRTATWERSFSELGAFHAAHHHYRVPRDWPNYPELGNWTNTQRQLRKNGRLSLHRIAQLEALGFPWDPHSMEWDDQFADLVAFRAQKQHCNVPRGWPDNPGLGSWINTQRRARKAGTLSAEKIAHLDALGFIWDLPTAIWEEQFSALLAYKAKHSDCNVPKNWPENPSLGSWIRHQRRQAKRGLLSNERVARLNAIGFLWNVWEALGSFEAHVDAVWEERFAELQAYKAKHGDTNVPRRWAENLALGTWANNQRSKYSRGQTSEEHIARLNVLGFEWVPRTVQWEEQFAALVAYKAKHGDCNVPAGWPENPTLARWIYGLREKRKMAQLSDERTLRLESLGFVWDPLVAQWERQFSALLAFKAAYHHCNVPRDGLAANPELGNWVKTQRTRRKHGRMSAERIARLDALGFRW